MTQSITPETAAQLIRQGALLVDIRQPQEHAREHIPQSLLCPLNGGEPPTELTQASAVIFYCQSGMCSAQNADRLTQQAAPAQVYLLSGGLNAWKRAGLPVNRDPGQPLDIMRQVQIAAGSLVLLGAALGYGVHPAGYLLSAFVGAGLVFAGVTGFCGLARLLMTMPWNRR